MVRCRDAMQQKQNPETTFVAENAGWAVSECCTRPPMWELFQKGKNTKFSSADPYSENAIRQRDYCDGSILLEFAEARSQGPVRER